MNGQPILCMSSEINETIRPLPAEISEEEARTIVTQVANLMRMLVHEQPWQEALLLSKRAENALRRQPVVTVGDVAHLIMGVSRPGQIKGAGYNCLKEIRDQLKLATSVW